MKLPHKSQALEQTNVINQNYSFFKKIPNKENIFSVCIDNDWFLPRMLDSLCNRAWHSCSAR